MSRKMKKKGTSRNNGKIPSTNPGRMLQESLALWMLMNSLPTARYQPAPKPAAPKKMFEPIAARLERRKNGMG